MTTPSSHCRPTVRFLALAIALSLLRPASGASLDRSSRSDTRCSPESSLDRLRQIAAALAGRGHVTVVLDPAVAPAVPPRMPPDDLPVDQGLDAALAPLRHVAWRRVCRTPAPNAALPDAGALSAAARALNEQPMGRLLIENPAAKRAVLFLKDQPPSAVLEGLREQGKLRREPIYLIYSTAAGLDAPTPERQLADLQQQQMEMAVPPERRALAMVQMMQLLQSMPPASREQFAQRSLQAGMRLWDSTPAAQRQEMIHHTVRLMQSFDAVPKPAADPRGAHPSPPAGPPPIDPRESGRRLAAALTTRCGATVLVEPALPLSQPVELPDGMLAVAQVLQTLSDAQPGTAWRRLSMTEAQLKRLPSAETLVAVVRTLEALDAGSLALEDRKTGRHTLYLRDQPPSIREEAMKAGGFRDQPIYLLYSATPAARGGTVLERFADLQRQQMGLMLQMSPDQMAHSMEQVIRSFQSGDDATRARLLGLPVTAGMMAVWFPEAAKQGGPIMP